eukprot:361689-Chlamydomonas_euryale.AAC.22
MAVAGGAACAPLLWRCGGRVSVASSALGAALCGAFRNMSEGRRRDVHAGAVPAAAAAPGRSGSGGADGLGDGLHPGFYDSTVEKYAQQALDKLSMEQMIEWGQAAWRDPDKNILRRWAGMPTVFLGVVVAVVIAVVVAAAAVVVVAAATAVVAAAAAAAFFVIGTLYVPHECWHTASAETRVRNPSAVVRSARHVQRELPKRLARRLLDLQLLPHLVVTNPHIKAGGGPGAA